MKPITDAELSELDRMHSEYSIWTPELEEFLALRERLRLAEEAIEAARPLYQEVGRQPKSAVFKDWIRLGDALVAYDAATGGGK